MSDGISDCNNGYYKDEDTKPILNTMNPGVIIDSAQVHLKGAVIHAENMKMTGVPALDFTICKVQVAMYHCAAQFADEMADLMTELSHLNTNIRGEDLTDVQSS